MPGFKSKKAPSEWQRRAWRKEERERAEAEAKRARKVDAEQMNKSIVALCRALGLVKRNSVVLNKRSPLHPLVWGLLNASLVLQDGKRIARKDRARLLRMLRTIGDQVDLLDVLVDRGSNL